MVDGLLGTVVELRIEAVDAAAAALAERRALDDIRRLQAVFSVYDPASELCRWRDGSVDVPSAELVEVLALAARWHRRSSGSFNPLTGLFTARWRRAEAEGLAPPDVELETLAGAVATLPYEVVDGRVHRTGDCQSVDLNALAKGWIADRAVASALQTPGVVTVVVNAGGDLAHRGAGSVRVGVENPKRPFDNEPPVDVVQMANAAIATSGGARRGFRVGGRRWSHVLDPRSGRTVEHTLSASVVAADAATADAIATVVGVLPVDEALAFIEPIADAACLLIDAAGVVHRSRRWPALGR
jgi:FAD:protein FMN transferase